MLDLSRIHLGKLSYNFQMVCLDELMIDLQSRFKESFEAIGLYISHQIVLAHKGRIWVESKQGQGSTSHVELPLEGRLENE